MLCHTYEVIGSGRPPDGPSPAGRTAPRRCSHRVFSLREPVLIRVWPHAPCEQLAMKKDQPLPGRRSMFRIAA
ncbi:hypothetical protein, partial [Streptomyces pristinaespiralis]|uniref:hypothetical protein n=1 Tax=Streptomyces pristinaespiralis TaxID=38300 RepID=UPI001F3DBA4D